MTTTTREPARTPADAQSAGSRPPATDPAGLIVMGIVWLGLSGAVSLLAALAAYRGADPTWFLGVLALGWSVIHTTSLPKRGGTR